MFKGINNPVQAFFDSGCNIVLAREEIMGSEIKCMPLEKGPIPMAVAGGATMYAKGVYGCLLPLADGGYQAARALTMDQVTQDMAKVHLSPLLASIKEEYKGLQKIQRVKVPHYVGGKVDMIIGYLKL